MTATLSLATPAGERPPTEPLPWRRMAWVTWRQHRIALLGALAFMAAAALLLWIAGLRLHHAYSAALTCKPASSFVCGQLANAFVGTNGFLSNGFMLQAIPPLVGVLVGAPLFAREFDSGTFRFAWTQGFGRARWALAKVIGIAGMLVVAAALFGLLVAWYYHPYLTTGTNPLSFSQATPLAPGLFDLRDTAFAGWMLLSFSIGAFAGVVIRRVVPAIVASLLVYAALAFAGGGLLRERYLTPLVTRALELPGSAWVITQQWLTAGGRPASAAALNATLLRAKGPIFTKIGLPKSPAVWRYLAEHGFSLRTAYQPASRFWPLQGIETGWLVALAVVLLVGSVWVIVRRSN